MPAASRLGDKASAPADGHGCPACPHPVVGPGVGGSSNVNVNGRPSLRLGDAGIHAACCGPNQWHVQLGSSSVSINGMPAARLGDATAHCGGLGKLIEGSGNVVIGGAPTAMGAAEDKDDASPLARASVLLDGGEDLAAALLAANAMLDRAEASLDRWEDADRANFKRWFGADNARASEFIRRKLRQSRGVLKRLQFSRTDRPGVFAYVVHDDPSHTVYLGPRFWSSAVTGDNSKAGTLLHESSHFDEVGHNRDHRLESGEKAYGHRACEQLADEGSVKAMTNADSYEYFVENAPP